METKTTKSGLQTKARIRRGNEAIECFRLVSAILVVFIHCRFPGFLGEVVNCLAKIAVPFFFVVSGYFAYRVHEKTIAKRLWSVVKLNILAHLLFILWDSYQAGIRNLYELFSWILDRCSTYSLSVLLLINKSPFRSHLWYLNVIILTYVVIWIYIRWDEREQYDYKPLYIVGICFYTLHVVLGSVASACGFEVPYHIYRNTLLFGLPMVVLGIFLREHGEKIIRVYKLTPMKLIGLIAVGACLSVLQWKGTGPVEMPVGILLEVIALMLLLSGMSELSGGSAFLSGMIATFGTLSTYVYITHMLWNDIYTKYIRGYVLRLGETTESMLYPLAIAAISLLTGIVYMGIKAALKRTLAKIKLTRGTGA